MREIDEIKKKSTTVKDIKRASREIKMKFLGKQAKFPRS